MRPWLVQMIDSNTISGLEWIDKVSAYSPSTFSSSPCCYYLLSYVYVYCIYMYMHYLSIIHLLVSIVKLQISPMWDK